MTTSEQIHELAAALAKAQGAMGGAKKDSQNPHFKSKYADLASIWEACRGPLSTNGLSVVQSPRLVIVEGQTWVELTTHLLHSSGQWMADTAAAPLPKPDAQGVGSVVTYLRRYALAAVAGIAPEDDDAEGAVARVPPTAAKAAPVEPAGFTARWKVLQARAEDGMDTLKKAWEETAPELRSYIQSTRRPEWDALKAKATAQAVPA